jgi:hypothetical protein
MIDDRSDLFESEKYPLIQSELLKRGIKLTQSSKLETLTTSKVNAEDKFQDFMLTVKKNDEKVLVVSANDFNNLGLFHLTEKGYKFIYR